MRSSLFSRIANSGLMYRPGRRSRRCTRSVHPGVRGRVLSAVWLLLLQRV